MDVFVYQAALLCDECGPRAQNALTVRGNAPDDVDDENTFDSDDFPKGPYRDGGGETDAPAHCDECNAYLEAPLTEEGVEYAVEHIRDHCVSMIAGKERARGNPEVLREWALDLRDHYQLEPEAAAVVDLLIEATAP